MVEFQRGVTVAFKIEMPACPMADQGAPPWAVRLLSDELTATGTDHSVGIWLQAGMVLYSSRHGFLGALARAVSTAPPCGMAPWAAGPAGGCVA